MSENRFIKKILDAEKRPSNDVWRSVESQMEWAFEKKKNSANNTKLFLFLLLVLIALGWIYLSRNEETSIMELEYILPNENESLPMASPKKNWIPPQSKIKTEGSKSSIENTMAIKVHQEIEIIQSKETMTQSHEKNISSIINEENINPRQIHQPLSSLPMKDSHPILWTSPHLNLSNYVNISMEDYRLHKRVGENLTFTLPSGFSLFSLLKENERIQDAHQTFQKLRNIETIVIKY
jgi:hypothetical protein